MNRADAVAPLDLVARAAQGASVQQLYGLSKMELNCLPPRLLGGVVRVRWRAAPIAGRKGVVPAVARSWQKSHSPYEGHSTPSGYCDWWRGQCAD